ncbi:MAG: UDP-N-acetylglucosamine 2-epimerase [Bdellovibrionales bacterium RIFOXYD1_FULL_53_11]|nr:MAG: UDP-N-acetylglucosamine 2-epimerase [Bdellovibrionales bacterium RIFOXYD1_FULL_53_11]
MKKMVLSVVLGTRPEVIKLAPVILEARRRGHQVRVVLTGQHRHMAMPMLGFFGIEPDVDLDVMQPDQTLTGLSARVLEKMDAMKDRVSGDVIAVQGDTTSAFVASYWGCCNRIPVAHVEAGLRTYDLASPFPEEANRQLIGRLARWHFAPTRGAGRALIKENVPKDRIHVVGNTGIDALKIVLARLKDAACMRSLPPEERLDPAIMDFVGGHRLVLVTAHRRESFGKGFEGICKGLRDIADARDGSGGGREVRIVYPVHPNPNVRSIVESQLAGHPRIMLVVPMQYVAFVALMDRADVLLTDSGGIQEEGPTLKKPVLVMREKTERPEGVKAGYVKLVGTDPGKILRETLLALRHGCRGRGPNPYGDGRAAARIMRKVSANF